jgi:hypothetical protein
MNIEYEYNILIEISEGKRALGLYRSREMRG